MVPTGFAGVPARPFIEVRLHVQGSTPTAIPFLIDTGADRSVLHPADASQLGMAPWEIDFSGAAPISGIGGGMRIMPITARAIFRAATDQDPRYVWMDSTIYLAEPSDENWDMPSLLGRDLLQPFRLVMEPSSAPAVYLEYRPDDDASSETAPPPEGGGR